MEKKKDKRIRLTQAEIEIISEALVTADADWYVTIRFQALAGGYQRRGYRREIPKET